MLRDENHFFVLRDENQKGKNRSMKSVRRDHPNDLIIGDIEEGMKLRPAPLKRNLSLLSTIEPKTFNEASNDEFWKRDMKEELDQIEKSRTWELFPRPQDKNIIDTKWVYRNKLDENGKVIRNKARLVCKGILKRKELILTKLLHLWLGWN